MAHTAGYQLNPASIASSKHMFFPQFLELCSLVGLVALPVLHVRDLAEVSETF